MKATPEKFQIVAVGERTYKENISFNLDNNVINCEESVKLLGVTVDFRLNFDIYMSNVCEKSFYKQINVLKQLVVIFVNWGS